MAHLLYCRKKTNKDKISKIARIRTEELKKQQPLAKVVKEIDVVDEVLQKGFEHPEFQSLLNNTHS